MSALRPCFRCAAIDLQLRSGQKNREVAWPSPCGRMRVGASLQRCRSEPVAQEVEGFVDFLAACRLVEAQLADVGEEGEIDGVALVLLVVLH